MVVQLHDTTEIYVPIAIERKEYRDSSYFAVVSGWHPSLDYIETYTKTQTITNYVDRVAPPTWTLSAAARVEAQTGLYQAKVGMLYERQISGPLRWSAEGGYQAGPLGRGPYVETSILLDFVHK